jgi:outer membrane protein assembly factor BamB
MTRYRRSILALALAAPVALLAGAEAQKKEETRPAKTEKAETKKDKSEKARKAAAQPAEAGTAASDKPAPAADRPAAAPAKEAEGPAVAMFGGTPSRNMVSDETGLPEKWDPKTGLNVKWTAELGSQSYAGPLVAAGRVYVGTNNERLYNPELKGDRGNVLAFSESDGKLLWQAAHPKLGAGRVNDWPYQGVCSTPYVEGDRVWWVSNEAHVVCADVQGFHDGENDGPFQDEEAKGPLDADFLWKYDMIGELDVFPHNLAAGNPLVVGDILYTVTGQGVDEGHVNIPSPAAPSFVALDKNTGELIWEDATPGESILHGSWSNPAYGVISGRPQVVIPGGDGWLYSFEPRTGKQLWRFDLNPKGTQWILGGRGTKNNVISTPVIWEDKIYIGVGQDPEHGEGVGNFWVIAPKDGEGDLTDKGVVVWHVGGEEFHRTLSTAAITKDGLLFIADLSGFLYCHDARTGKRHWTHDLFAAVWGSAFAADGKVYIGDEDGDVAVFAASAEKKLLHEVNMGAAVYTTPVAHDGTLFVVSRTKLFAIRDGIPPKTAPAKPAAPVEN